MRYIFAILLIISGECYGQQEKVNTMGYHASIISAIDSNGIITWNAGAMPTALTPLNVQTHTVIYDTIPCIMLVCDTSEYEGIMMNGNIRKDLVNQHPYWMKGYEVREKPTKFPLSTYAGNSNTYLTASGHIAWLDADKKQLSKHIIVWQSK